MSNVVKTDYVGKFKPEGDSVMNRILGFLSAEPAVRSMFTELLSDPCYEYVDAKLGMDVVAVSKDDMEGYLDRLPKEYTKVESGKVITRKISAKMRLGNLQNTLINLFVRCAISDDLGGVGTIPEYREQTEYMAKIKNLENMIQDSPELAESLNVAIESFKVKLNEVNSIIAAKLADTTDDERITYIDPYALNSPDYNAIDANIRIARKAVQDATNVEKAGKK